LIFAYLLKTKNKIMGELTIDQKLEQFYKDKKKLDILTKKVAEQKIEVTEFLKTQPELKYSIGDTMGFSLRSTPVYKFSETVEGLEKNAKLIAEKIKEVKANEIKDEIATIVSNQYAVYTK